MNKTQRNYKLVYTVPPEKEGEDAKQITITYPLMIDIDVRRDTCATSNTGSFRLINLAKSTREEIFQDLYQIDRMCFVDLYAGYGNNMPLIFTGKVLQAYSGREGTEVITDIQALDNDIIQSYSSHVFEAGTPKTEVLTTLMQDMPNVQLGAVGTMEGGLITRTVFDDQTFVAINKLTGGQAFIDLNKLNVLNANECLGDVGIYKITSETGLIGTPRRRDAMLEVDLIFAPEIQVGQLVDIESMISTEFNGQYKVLGIHHHGSIGGQVSTQLVTTLTLFVGSLLPNSNSIFTGVPTVQPLSEVKNNKVQEVGNATINSIRAIRKEIMQTNKVPHKRITKNIWWDEVIGNYSRQGEVPSIEVMANLYSVATQLQSFVDKFYPNNKIIITSGWRSKSYNATIPNAARNSAHITGEALDFYLPGQILAYVYRNFKTAWSYRRYMGNGFIHGDLAIEKGPIANDK